MICNRCGKCCFVETLEPGKLKACKFLVKVGSKYSCRIYSNRLGSLLSTVRGFQIRCILYNELVREILGCPLNLGTKPVYSVEIDKKEAILSKV